MASVSVNVLMHTNTDDGNIMYILSWLEVTLKWSEFQNQKIFKDG
jgi:hypothetical protein